jgi:hypothetical protein
MALAVSAYKRFRLERIWKVIATLVFSSTYATPGDTLSFLLAGIPQSGAGAAQKPLRVIILGKGVYDYKYVPGTTRDDGTVKVLTAGVEHTNAAYNAAVTGDTITVDAEFAA